jgi:glutathione S-transferase
MQLFYSPNSPYARIARVAVREFGLLDRVDERKAANRQPDNPVLAFSAAGRVPTLVDGDLVLTEARYVFDYIAAKGRGAAVRDTSAIDWRERALEGQVLGFVDGIANWVRERRRPSEQQSGFLIEVEIDRSARCLDHLEGEAARQRPEFPTFNGVALAAGLGLMDFNQLRPDWRSAHPALSRWYSRCSQRPSMIDTAPE